MAVTSNPKAWGISFMLVVALAMLCSTHVGMTTQVDNVKEYVLTVGNEELRFTARPELGYVVKTRQDMASIDALDGILKSVGAADISPIRGLGRKGVCVVYSERPADENEKLALSLSNGTVRLLRSHSEVQYAAPLFSSNGETVAVIPEIVVRVKPGTDIEQVQRLSQGAGCTISKRMEFTEQEYLLEVLGPDAEVVFAAVEQLGQAPCVEWACPNTASQPKPRGQAAQHAHAPREQLRADAPADQDANSPGVFPNDEYFPLQWHLHNTGQSGGTPGADTRATEAWEITTGGPNIIVAVFDTGVDTKHPDLINNLVRGYDFIEDDDLADPGPYDIYNAHGTGCAGIVGAQGNNAIGVTGIAWNCKVMPIRIAARPTDSTWDQLTEADLATAFRWAAAHGADIVSSSWITHSSNQPAVHSAIVDITSFGGLGRNGKGCVFLALAGNKSGSITVYPQKYPEVIVVGATDHNDLRCSYSNFGPELDIVAPSGWQVSDEDFARSKGIGSLWTTDLSGPAGWNFDLDPNVLDYTAWGGTCGACSVGAGVAALILSVDPNLTNLEVQRILMRSARDLGERGWDQYYGFGRVDARAAVEMAMNPPPPSFFYVDDDALDDPGPGDPGVSDPNEDGSVEHPYDSIQEAINNAVPGDTVIVLLGTYVGTGNRDISFLSRAITVRSVDANDSAIVAGTVIDCQGTQTAQHQGFLFNKGESAQSVLAGLTITNAYSAYGGGVLCTGDSSPTISKCVLKGNRATQRGGGMYNASGSPLVANCIFSGNTAADGGALYNLSNAKLVNCTFINNSATSGSKIHNQGGTLTLTNCILWDNTPPEVRVGAGTVSVTYSDIKGGFAGAGNITADPLFADPAKGDYHLKSHGGRWDPVSKSWVIDGITSPCIDAGDPSSPVGDEPQPNGTRINMGAYGGTAEASKSPVVQ